MHKFYIIFSRAIDKFYIGQTSDDLYERIRRHNTNHNGYTGRANDWELVYKKEFTQKSMARKIELQVKNWKSRNMIEKIIQIYGGKIHSYNYYTDNNLSTRSTTLQE